MQLPREDICVAAYLIQNPDILAKFEKDLLKYPFSNKVLHWVYNALCQGWVRNGRSSFPTLSESLILVAQKSHALPEGYTPVLLDLTERIYKENTTGLTADRVVTYILEQRAVEIQSRLDNPSPDSLSEIGNLLQDLRVMRDSPLNSTQGFNPFDPTTFAHITTTSASVSGKVPTGFLQTDAKLLGGLRRGEVFLIIAPTGKGKTRFFLSTMVSMIEQGYRVMYVGLDNPFEEVGLRVLERALRQAFHLSSGPEFQAMREWYLETQWEGRDISKHLFMLARKHFSTRPTMQDIQTYMLRLSQQKDLQEYDRERGVPEGREGKFDAVFVDYLDRMVPAHLHKNAATYERLAAICEDAQELALIEDSAVVTASQVNRGGYSKDNPDMTDVAGSWDKVNPAGVVALHRQSPAEEDAKKFRLAYAKVRRGVDPFEVAYGYSTEVTEVWELSDPPTSLATGAYQQGSGPRKGPPSVLTDPSRFTGPIIDPATIRKMEHGKQVVAPALR